MTARTVTVSAPTSSVIIETGSQSMVGSDLSRERAYGLRSTLLGGEGRGAEAGKSLAG